MRMLQQSLVTRKAVVVPTAKNLATNITQSYSCKHAGVEAVVETSNKHVSSFGNEVRKDSTAETDVEDDMKAEQRKGRRHTETTQHVRSNEFEDEDPEVKEKKEKIGRRHVECETHAPEEITEAHSLRQDGYVKELRDSDGDVESLAMTGNEHDARVLVHKRPDHPMQDLKEVIMNLGKARSEDLMGAILLDNDRKVVELNKMLKLRYSMKKTETQIAKPFVKQLRKDNHFGCSKEPHKVIKLLRMGEEIEELDKGTLRECDMKIREIGQDDDEETSEDEDNEGWNVSMPDDAEGQRQNPTVDMSKRSLGRVKHVQTNLLWIREQIALNHFVSSKVSTLLNRADNLTKQ